METTSLGLKKPTLEDEVDDTINGIYSSMQIIDDNLKTNTNNITNSNNSINVINTQLNEKAINIKNFGAHSITEAGYENFDSTIAINDAITFAINNNLKYIEKPYGMYIVNQMPTYTAPIELIGTGILIKASDSRVVDYMDRYNDLIFGMEYLSNYHGKLVNKFPAKIVFSGDSTTELGKFVEYSDTFIKQTGISTAICINKGHAGQSTVEWLASYLDEDLALNPDLYVVRWGVNDTSSDYSLAKVKAFETRLREGLGRIRALKTPAQMSILLMTTNICEFYTKDKRWGRQINSIIRKCARDFQCCFADTYMYLEDGYNNPSWLDAQLIHPLPVGDRWIVDLISDILVPNTLRTYIQNPPATAEYKKSINDLGSTYPIGNSVFRTNTTFPFDGLVFTVFQTGGVLLQINCGYDSTKENQIAIRYGTVDTWGKWVNLSRSIVDCYETTIPFLASTTPENMRIGVTNYRATIANGFPKEGSVTTFNNADQNICKQELVSYDATNTVMIRTWNVLNGTWNAWRSI